MTLEELINRAEKQFKCSIGFHRLHDGTCTISASNKEHPELRNIPFTKAIDTLTEWATPKFVTVTFPYLSAKLFVDTEPAGYGEDIAVIITRELDRLNE